MKLHRCRICGETYLGVERPSHCPFCGAIVVDTEAAEKGGEMATPCPHTLFIAHDAGFEHRDDRVNVNLNIVGVEDDDLELNRHGAFLGGVGGERLSVRRRLGPDMGGRKPQRTCRAVGRGVAALPDRGRA